MKILKLLFLLVFFSCTSEHIEVPKAIQSPPLMAVNYDMFDGLVDSFYRYGQPILICNLVTKNSYAFSNYINKEVAISHDSKRMFVRISRHNEKTIIRGIDTVVSFRILF